MGLPDERKALAERYTIDAEEAELRARRASGEQSGHAAAEQEEARLAGEEQARREAEARARLAAEEQARHEAAEEEARRHAAEEQARREAEEQARRAAEEQLSRQAAEDDPAQATRPATDEFPIYEWLQRAAPAPDDTADWTRSLLKAKEERLGETPRV